MSNGEMSGHVEARRESIRDKAARGDARARRNRDDGRMASVAVLLARWGRWSIRCESGALGFAASCILGGGGGGDAYDSAVPRGVVDGDMEAVDGAVRKLPSVLRLAVIELYRHGSGQSVRKVAGRMGVSDKTLSKYISEAQQKIALDIAVQFPQNPLQSANGGSCPSSKNQPVTA